MSGIWPVKRLYTGNYTGAWLHFRPTWSYTGLQVPATDFTVSPQEFEYVRQVVADDESLAALVSVGPQCAGAILTIRLTREEAERLRDRLTGALAESGFDEDYSPNERGRLLETLIDRFYTR